MPRLVILIALIFLAWLALRWFVRTPPEQVSRTLKQAALWGVAIVFIALAATGRLHWVIAAGAAMLPFARRAFGLIRFLPLAKNLYGRYQAKQSYQAPKTGQTSTVETRFLRMTLDHDTGDMDGEILDGGFEDRLLSQLTLDELLNLRTECQREDPESASLLEAYLDRSHPEWREQTDTQSNNEAAAPTSDSMTPEEAREILGVDKSASEQEITQAHRRLMHKLHPDRGGSDYLATKINLAKDCLLGK
ncbi:MAG: DnaJ domain-containing protein [Gammaproteobacteria bacterium]|nr:DnaJ domain-containing protein [Gammaproteobacteria bacterium]